jgi:hypothetical protein
MQRVIDPLNHSFSLQYGKTAKYYVYAPGDIDLNTLVNRCKEMPRRREHQDVRKYSTTPQQQVQQDVFVHTNPPRGAYFALVDLGELEKLHKKKCSK